MGNRAARRAFLAVIGAGALAAVLSPVLAKSWGWERVLVAACWAGAAAGPPMMLLVLGGITPGPSPRRTVLRAAGGGMAAVAVLALVGRGGLGSTTLGALGGILVVVPTYLAVTVWVLVGMIRSDAVTLSRARSGVVLAAVLGLLTWAVPAGLAVNAWDVARARSFVEKLAGRVEEEKARTGSYPAPGEIDSLARSVGWRPVLLWGGVHYYLYDGSYEIGFTDRTEMFGGYLYRGPAGDWVHWVD